MNAKILVGCGLVLVVCLIVPILFGIGVYNGLVGAEERVVKEWSEIDNMLQRRADLIPNLVETVKGYAKHESEIFREIADARSRLIGAKGVDSKAVAIIFIQPIGGCKPHKALTILHQ